MAWLWFVVLVEEIWNSPLRFGSERGGEGLRGEGRQPENLFCCQPASKRMQDMEGTYNQKASVRGPRRAVAEKQLTLPMMIPPRFAPSVNFLNGGLDFVLWRGAYVAAALCGDCEGDYYGL